jgi:hypothetical protein
MENGYSAPFPHIKLTGARIPHETLAQPSYFQSITRERNALRQRKRRRGGTVGFRGARARATRSAGRGWPHPRRRSPHRRGLPGPETAVFGC